MEDLSFGAVHHPTIAAIIVLHHCKTRDKIPTVYLWRLSIDQRDLVWSCASSWWGVWVSHFSEV